MFRGKDTTDTLDTDEWATCTAVGPALTELPVSEVQHLLQEGVLRTAPPPARHLSYTGETPIEGAGAVARWVALYDRAREVRAALLRVGDSVGERQARRVVRSLFLYEHQLTPKARRQARLALWRRDRAGEPLPPFIARVGWSQCRCPRCQPRPAVERAGVSLALRTGGVLQSA